MTTFRDIPKEEYFHYICIGRHKENNRLWGFIYSDMYRGVDESDLEVDSDSYSIYSLYSTNKDYIWFNGTDIEKDHIEIYADKKKCAERMVEIVREAINTVGCDIRPLRQAIRMVESTKDKQKRK